MNNLVPEKRMDRNGKLVTKHVRSGLPQTSTRTKAPAPSLGAKQSSVKLTPKQLEKREMDFRNIIDLDGHFGVFKASDAEFYDVVSATSSNKSALLAIIRNGCRTKDDTLEALAVTGDTNELGDRTAMAQEALKRRIKPEDFVDGCGWIEHKQSTSRPVELDESSPEGIKQILDTVEFYSLSMKGSSGLMWHSILSGSISYDDIKHIGASKLKAYNRLHSLSEALVKLQKGEADYDVDDLKRLVERDADERKASLSEYSTRNTEGIFFVAAKAIVHKGTSFIDKVASLDDIAKNYWSYQPLSTNSSGRNYEPSELWDRIEYATLAKAKYEEHGSRWMSTHSARLDEMMDAGIPMDVAVDVLAAGGGVLEAKAIHEEGINKSVSGGWL